MEYYFLMHEDVKVAFFSVVGNTVQYLELSPNTDFYPVGCYSESSVKEWLMNRGVPLTRNNLRKEFGKNVSPFKLMLSNGGVSLSDHYWIKERSSKDTWESVNAYTNDFKAVHSVNISDDLNSMVSLNPSTSLQGDMQKKWIIDKSGVRTLIKVGNRGSCRQSICEVFASEIYKRHNVFYTPYSLVYVKCGKDTVIGCECPNFISIDTEFIPAISVINSQVKPNDISYYEHYIKICKEHDIDVRWYLELQILVNFIITNTDWNLNNFGIVRNTKSLRWLAPAPVFDSGNSLFYGSNYIPVGDKLLDIEINSFYDKEVELLKQVKNRWLIDLRLLPSENELFELLKIDSQVSDETNERIVKAYLRKIKYMEDYQNGADLWSYKYKKGSKK